MTDTQILTPRCPVCDQPPAIAGPMLATWFCSNDDCTVWTWDPTKLLDELLTNVGTVELTGFGEPDQGAP